MWDVLPANLTCATDITYVSTPAGTCTGNTIVWTLPGPIDPGTSALIDYTVTVPAGIAAGESITNHAGVRNYQNDPNDGGTPVIEYPANNIDPTVPAASINSPAADDTATLTAPSVLLAKTRTTSVSEPGNDPNTQATIGEDINYTVTATLPANTSLYDAAITDAMGTTTPAQSLLTAPAATATYDGAALPAGFTFTPSVADNRVTLAFPAGYSTGASTHTIVITFSAVVNDVAANVLGATLTNTADLNYNYSGGGPAPTTAASASTTIVEPSIGLAKTDDSVDHTVESGQTVTYTLTVSNSNATDVSTAHDIVVTDVLPLLETAPTSISDGGTYNSATSTITWDLGPTTLAPGADLTLTYTVQIFFAIGQNQLTNNATVTVASLDSGGRTAGPGYQALASDTVTVVGATVTKTDSPGQTTIGVPTTYTLTVDIPHNLNLPAATVDDLLPDGMIFDAYGTTTCSDGGLGICAQLVGTGIGTPTKDPATGTTPLGWYLGNLTGASGPTTVTFTYTAYPAQTYNPPVGGSSTVKAGDVLTNSALVRWNLLPFTTPPTAVPTTSNFASESSTAPLTVVEPDLAIAKTASTTSPQPGVPFRYSISITNNGTSPAYDGTVTDPIPSSLVLLSAGPAAGTNAGSATVAGSTVTWTFPGPIAPGATITLPLNVELGPSSQLTDGQVITNTATLATYYGVSSSTDPGHTDTARYRTYGPATASAGRHAHLPDALTPPRQLPPASAPSSARPSPGRSPSRTRRRPRPPTCR